jgi:hypothetical protein
MYGRNISTFPSGLISITDYQCWRDGGGGGLIQITGTWRSRRGPGLDYFAHVLCISQFLGGIFICGLYKLTPLDQTQVSTQMKSISDLVVV